MKEDGWIEHLMGLLPILAAALLGSLLLQLAVHQAAGTFIEDALASSNLASAVMDLKEYGRNGRLVAEDPRDSYGLFLKMLKENLKLDEAWMGRNTSIINGLVTVYEYSLYEVAGTDVVRYRFLDTGILDVTTYGSGAGTVTAPDGTVIRSTSVYSRIGFPVTSMGRELYCYQEKCVDVVRN